MIRKILLLALFYFLIIKTSNNYCFELDVNVPVIKLHLLYDNIIGTVYNPVKSQCDDTPHITADLSFIDVNNASNHRWIAISQDLLYDEYRKKFNGNENIRFNGKLKYGDTIWIESPYVEINGWWVVHDAMNKRYTNRIDFLQTMNDNSLYKNYPKWPGKFDNIKIYSIDYGKRI